MTQTVQSILYPEDARRPLGIDIAGMEFDRGFGTSPRRRVARSPEELAAKDIELQALRERLAAMGERK